MSDLNALLGTIFEHDTYVSLTSSEVTPTEDGGQAHLLPGSADGPDVPTGTISSAYANLLPLADVVNALFTTLPAYDVSLFINQLEAGHLLDAIGNPIAADVASAPIGIALASGLLN